MKKKLLSLLLTFCTVVSLLPAPALAAGAPVTLNIADGNIVISSTGYSISGARTAYTGAYILTGTSEHNIVAVESGSYAITLQDLNISLGSRRATPFTIQPGANVDLTLEGANTLAVGYWDEYAALRLPKGASLTVTAESTGSLTASSYRYGAGIGGVEGEDAGDVTIHGGTIDASSSAGAGIGGGSTGNYNMTSGSGGHVVVTGGNVTVRSWGGAGIGGGGGDSSGMTGGAAGTVEISGGVVHAEGSPGIGSADYAAEGGAVSFTGGFVAAWGLDGSDPIGAGQNSDVEISISAENCVLIENDTGTVYGSAVLPCDYNVLEGAAFTIPAGATLTVPEGVTLGNCGTLQNNGALIGTGTVYGVVSGNLPASTLAHMDIPPLEEVSTEAQLRAATGKALWNVKLTQDVDLTSVLRLAGKGTIDGGGHTLFVTGSGYGDGVCVENGHVAMRDLTLTGGAVCVTVDWKSEAVFDNCLITDCEQAIGNDGKVILNDCTVSGWAAGIHGNVAVLNRCLVTGSSLYSALSGQVFLANSIVTGNIYSNESEHMGAVMPAYGTISNSIILGNYDVHDGAASAYDLDLPQNFENGMVAADSIVGCSRDYQGNEILPDVVLDSRINDGAELGGIFAQLTTVTVDGIEMTVPVVDSDKRGIAAVRLTDEWAEKINARPRVMFSVEGYHGEYDSSDMLIGYGVTLVSSVPYTAYFSDQEPLTAENYLEKGTTDQWSMSLNRAGEKTIYYYVLRDGFPPEAGSTEIVVTKGTQEAIEADDWRIAFDAVNSALKNVMDGWEYSADGGVTWTPCKDTGRDPFPVSHVTAELDILLRREENDACYASPAVVVPVEKREKPAGVTVTQPVTPMDTGAISGVTADMEYSADNGGNWVEGTGANLENISPGAVYLIRTKAAGNALASDPIAIMIQCTSSSQVSVPAAAIDYESETLTGLTGSILVDGTPYTGTDPLPIEESWFGKTIEIVQRGDGSATKDSEAQQLPIDARPAAPTVTTANETYPGAGDGRLSTDHTMEYRMDSGAVWIDCTGETTGLAAGTYFVRFKSAASAFASETIAVTVGSDEAQPDALPAAAVSADGNYLENLTAGETYVINGAACTADQDGKIEISRSWHGMTLQIVKKGNGASTVDSDAQYLAVPALAAYTVTYDLNGGTANVKDETPYLPGDTVNVKFAPAPQMTGGVFLGWAASAGTETPSYTESGTKTFTMGEENVTLYAVWDTVKYVITWNVNGATTTTQAAYNHLPVYSGTPEKTPTDTEEYTFAGWQPKLAPARENVTYTAQFTSSPRTYSVTLNANGGTVGSGNVTGYTYGTGATLPADVTRNDCAFLGWFDNENCAGNPVASISATDTGDKVFYARWKISAVPNAAIDFSNETFTGLTAGGNYKIDGAACTADGNGEIAIQPAWMGKTVSIAAAGNGTNTLDGEAQNLNVSARPAAPAGITAEDETSAKNDGKILNVTTDMEYSEGDTNWTDCTGTEITGLSGGSYKVRLKATASAFASEAVTVTVKAYQAPSTPTTPPAPDDPDDPDNPPVWENPFTDVKETDWYYEAVEFANETGLFYGAGEKTFAPNGDMTRGMLAAVLYRLAKEPGTTADDLFSDVADGRYYTEAIVWAAKNNIVAGYGNNRFGPEDSITREQLATILWRYADSPESSGKLDSFTDGSNASNYAVPALKWAVEQKIVSGKGGGILDPKGKATRAEVAAMLMRYCEKAK